MNYLEIQDGMSIAIDKIEMIRKKDDMISVVHTASNSYETMFPYSTLIEILINRDIPKSSQLEEKVAEMSNIIKEVGITSP